MAQLRWVHLSDFHVGKDRYGQRKMFRAILDHICARKGSGREPNFVFITGDLANSGRSSEYQEFAEEFLLPLFEILGQDADRRVYCIPGNHDVDRTKAPFISREVIFKRSIDFLDPTLEGASLREHILPRFAGFIECDLTSSGRHWLRSEAGALVDLRKVGELSLAIIGLNTAWHAQDDQDLGQLMAGADILETALALAPGADLYIVLGHHPLEWLLSEDSHAIRTILARKGALYLHGHYHKTETHLEYGSSRLFRTFQSGACFQARGEELWQNRLLWCEIDWPGRSIIAEPFTWVDHEREWRIDGRAFPEENRLPDSTRWEFQLPGTSTMPDRGTLPADFLTPAGWELIDGRALFEKTRAISDNELVRYFDGSVPDWSIALSPRVPRRQIVSEIAEVLIQSLGSAGPTLCVILGAGGEGKTTATIQAIATVLEQQAIDIVMWRSSSAVGFEPSFLNRLHGKQIAVVADDGHNLAPTLSDHLTSPRGQHDKALYLLCSRDTDWLAVGAGRTAWQTICKYHEFKLRGLSRADAHLVVDAWRTLGDRGLGQLKRLAPEMAVERLLSEARDEAYFDEGAFLGALLRTRIGPGLRDHVKALLTRFEEKSAGKTRRLIDAFAFICAVHSEGLDILTDEILGWTMHLNVGDLRRSVISRLGEEAAATAHGNLVVSRHREIARTAISILIEERGYHLAGLFQEILLAADRAASEGHFVAKLSNWRFGLVDHFLTTKRFSVAQSLARALVDQNPTNPFFATKFSSALRLAGEAMEASRFMENAFLRVSLGRDGTRSFYREWSADCAEAGEPALAAWLAGVVLSDLDNVPFDYKLADLFFRDLKSAMKVIERENGRDLPPNSFRDVEVARRIVESAWQHRERDLPSLVPPGNSLAFDSLRTWLDRRI